MRVRRRQVLLVETAMKTIECAKCWKINDAQSATCVYCGAELVHASGDSNIVDPTVQAVFNFAAGLIREGKSGQEIQSRLIKQGLDRESAFTVVVQLTRARCAALADAGISAIGEALAAGVGQGLVWVIGAAIFTWITYTIAPFGIFLVATGAFLYGAKLILNGLGVLVEGLGLLIRAVWERTIGIRRLRPEGNPKST